MFNNNLLMGAAAAASGGASLVSVGNSALFTSNSQELERTPSGAGNVDKWTFSTWVYFCDSTNATSIPIFTAINTSANQHAIIISNTGQIYFQIYLSSAHAGRLITTQLLRDIGWYHIVVVYDSGNALASNREIIYLNGKRITEFATEAYVSQNLDGLICGTHLHQVGMSDGLTTSLNGYLAETVLLDGTAAEPTSFGAYDSSGLFWTPLASDTIKELTFGTTGFYLDNTTNAQTDASGQGNNFTNTGSVTLSTHTPTNYTALLNPLYATNGNVAYSNGNRTIAANGAVNEMTCATLAIPPNSGKWYFDVSWDTWADAYDDGYIGIALGSLIRAGMSNPTTESNSWNIYMTDPIQIILGDGSNINTTQAFSQIGDIFQVAYDSDTGKLFLGYYDASATAEKWFSGDGTATAGDPSAGSNPTVTLSVADRALPLFPFAGIAGNSGQKFTVNFEEDEFARTAPTGFKALTTTNIAAATTRTASDTTKYFDTILYEGNGQGQRVGQFQPFGDLFTVAKSGLWSASSADLTRGSMSGTGTTWTFSAWVKRAEPAVGSATANFVFTTASNAGLAFGGAGTADEVAWYSGSYTGATNSDLVNDQSQWYHVVVKNDGGTGTIYLNGNEVLGSVTVNAADATMAIGSYNGSSNEFDGYISEVVFVESALAPTSFAKTDTSTNRWVPIDVSGLTYSGNSFYLNFADSSDLGNDVSGNNKDFTNNSGVLSSTDSPTTNIATLSATDKSSGITLSNGNRTFAATTNQNVHGTIPLPSSGKYYWEVNLDTASSAAVGVFLALNGGDEAMTTPVGSWGTAVSLYRSNSGNLKIDGSDLFTFSGVSPINTTWQVAVDLDNNKMWFGIDNTWCSSTGLTGGNPSTGANPVLIRDFTGYKPLFGIYSNTMTVDFDSANWGYTAPTDYVALTQDSLPSTDQFISAFSWIKNRDATDNHMLFDRVRGVTKDIHSNATSAQVTNTNTLQSFLAGGVQVGNDVEVNTANESYVLWNWMTEATGSGSANEAGSVNTTSTLVDTTLGLSISQFECPNDSNDFTIGHGLGAVPKVVLLKSVDDDSYNWSVFHASTMDNQDYLKLNSNAAQTDYGANIWGAAVPTSTVIGITANVAVLKNTTCICYAFADSQFIATGKYTGNGNVNGTLVPTVNSLGIPIQPIFLLYKDIGNANSWCIADTKRSPFNVGDDVLFPDATDVEQTNSINNLDIVTGGLKFRTTYNRSNGSSYNYIYMAIGTPIIDTDGRIIAGR